MAEVHNALTRGPLGKALKAAVGDQTTDGMLERFGETLTPTIDLWSMPEWAFLRSERLVGGVVDVTGAAGTCAEGLLYNPPTSKGLVVLSRIRWMWLTAGTGFHYRIFRGAAPPAGFVDVNCGPVDTRDPKLIAAPAVMARLMQAANAAASGGLAFDLVGTLVAGVLVDDYDPIILAPGTGFVFGSNAVGVQRFIAGVRWRERFGFASELGF